MRLDWDIVTPRKYRLPDGQMSDEDEIFDQNPTTVLDGFEEKSTGNEDWTGHGFYWALWSTRSALPGGMIFTNADSQKRQTRFYRQYLSNFEGTFNSTAKLKLPIPDVAKDRVKVRSTIIYYSYESPSIFENLPSPEIEKRKSVFFVGAHGGEMYLSTDATGYPIGIKRKVLEEFAQKFRSVNAQVEQSTYEIPMTFNINPTFIRAGLLPELLIISRENGIRPRLIIQASNQEAMGIDETAYNRGKTLAEDVQDAINVLKKIDKNYSPLQLAFTNEPNLIYDEPFPSLGWTGTGRAEGGGKFLYKACQHFLEKCPDAEIGLPALVIVGRHPNVIKSSHVYAREFFEEVAAYGLPKNVKQIYVNAFGTDPINALIDTAYVPSIWETEAEKLGLKVNQIPQDVFVTEMGPGDVPDGSGNEYERTAPFLQQLAEIIAQIKEKNGGIYQAYLSWDNPEVRNIVTIFPRLKGMTFFTWFHDGSKMTFHPEIKFNFK